MKLKDFMELKKFSRDTMAAMVGVTYNTLSSWLRGAIPQGDQARMVEHFTQGLVTRKDFGMESSYAMTDSEITVKEAAQLCKVTAARIYQAKAQGRIKGRKVGNALYVDKTSVEEFRRDRRTYKIMRYNGELIYDVDAGKVSPAHLAKMLGVSQAYVYEMIHRGEVPHSRSGKYIVVDYAAFQALKLSKQQGNPKQMRLAV